jgi:hypothetical protein
LAPAPPERWSRRWRDPRGFLGFAQTGVTDLQSQIRPDHHLRQDFPYIGTMATATKPLNSLMLNQTTSSYQFSNVSGPASVSTPSNSSAPYRVSLSESVARSADLLNGI